ncbi:MAG: hypothetical protein PHV06_11515 [bacterium]|nr:hypothetical protein [bacterium]
MPGCYDDSKKIIKYIADNISSETYLNLMAQYYPEYKARNFLEINRII